MARCFSVCACLFVAASLAFSAPALANNWTAAEAANGVFSANTPCSPEELNEPDNAPTGFGENITLEVSDRIICQKRGLQLIAGTMSFETTSVVAFDFMIEQLLANGANATEEQLNGKRAIFITNEASGGMGMTGFVEVSEDTVIIVIAGAAFSQDLGKVAATTSVQRFVSSIRVLEE